MSVAKKCEILSVYLSLYVILWPNEKKIESEALKWSRNGYKNSFIFIQYLFPSFFHMACRSRFTNDVASKREARHSWEKHASAVSLMAWHAKHLADHRCESKNINVMCFDC